MVRMIRQKTGWTQTRLASHLGVSVATVIRWESGQRRPQHAATDALLALARELDVKEDTPPVVPKQQRPRIQFEATPERLAEVDHLAKLTALDTRKGVLDEALVLYQWAVMELGRGKVVGSRAPDGTFIGMTTPGLGRVARALKPVGGERTTDHGG